MPEWHPGSANEACKPGSANMAHKTLKASWCQDGTKPRIAYGT